VCNRVTPIIICHMQAYNWFKILTFKIMPFFNVLRIQYIVGVIYSRFCHSTFCIFNILSELLIQDFAVIANIGSKYRRSMSWSSRFCYAPNRTIQSNNSVTLEDLKKDFLTVWNFHFIFICKNRTFSVNSLPLFFFWFFRFFRLLYIIIHYHYFFRGFSCILCYWLILSLWKNAHRVSAFGGQSMVGFE